MKKIRIGVRRVTALMITLWVLACVLAPPGHSQKQKIKSPIQPESHEPNPSGRIAFASDRTGNFEIYVMNPDGGGLVQITDNPAEDLNPTWSPDGTRLAFTSN